MTETTIYALATGRPPAAIGVIRISGAGAHQAAALMVAELPPVRSAVLRTFRHPVSAEQIDEGLVLRFDGPASATGEDLVELHCHGGRAVVDALLGALAGIDGVRLAEPGEFTRRAFENGRIDFTEAEGLADLLEAETESQRRAALAVAEGGLRRQIAAWQDQLLQLSARAEAAIDYVDEDEVAADDALKGGCGMLAEVLAAWLERPRVEPLKEGVRVVLAGPPNAGKSSLINALAGTERAIVTAVPGTTRDHIEVPLAIRGIPILLTDTAGLRETEDAVERIGVERSRSLVDSADVLLWLGEPQDAPLHPRAVLVHPRFDLPDRRQVPDGAIGVSAATGEGLAALMEHIEELARAILPGEDAISLNRRQASHLEEARAALDQASRQDDIVFLAEDLRAARAAFDRLTGRAGVENVLDALFGRFCLGK